ncbi:hypothetical protein UPYG_G00066330 [Umbra pygmaea]|uniref:Rho-related GTP-binding protein RhoU-like n=1 Tax=Umbra pygmaea TaxID=75934 RepID=A0ABD0XAH7_UMBPY
MLPQAIEQQKPRVSDPAPPVPPRRVKNSFPVSKRQRSGYAPERRVNCVLVGDGGVGKTSLIVSYTTNGYPTEYIPTAFDNFAAMVVVDEEPVRLQLCDMAGQDELEQIRPLCYRNADVFLLCYSAVRPSSLRNATNLWAPEIRRHRPGAPIVLVGTQLDLQEDVQVLIQLDRNQERPVSTEEANHRAQEIGAVSFVECSALTQKNLKEVFDHAILASIQQEESVQSALQTLSLRRKTPEKIQGLSETWWRKLSCVVAPGECLGGDFS